MLSAALILANLSFNALGFISFKLSVAGRGARRFLLWQAVGNVAGFLGVLAFTFLLKLMSLEAAFPLTQGLTVLAVQVFGSWLVFKERITPVAWTATGLVVAGVVLLSM